MLDFPLATPRMPELAVHWFAEADSRNTNKPQPETYGTVECEDYSMLKRMVLTSDCISAALLSTVAEEVESGSLVILPVRAPAIKTMAGIVYRRGCTLSPIA